MSTVTTDNIYTFDNDEYKNIIDHFVNMRFKEDFDQINIAEQNTAVRNYLRRHSRPAQTNIFASLFDSHFQTLSGMQLTVIPMSSNPANTGTTSIFTSLINLINGLVDINQNQVPLTLTENSLKSLPVYNLPELKNKVNISKDDQCSVCLGNILDDDANNLFILLKCNHFFHKSCITEHLQNYDYHCPVCRSECGEHMAKIENN